MENPNKSVEVVRNVKTNVTYTKELLLGKGGFAKCYLSRDEQKRYFALKEIYKEKMDDHDTNMIKKEICIHRSLNHQNIVKFYDFFTDNKCIYIILELCCNMTLEHLQRRRIKITEPEARYFAIQIIDGCKYIHDKRIIHRDLKLQNILLTKSMIVKIADFGLSTLAKDDKNDTVCGTPNYMAPELLKKSKYGYEIDHWAIGIIMYILIVGEKPFIAHTFEEICNQVLNNNVNFPSTMGVHSIEFVSSLLSANPEQRPALENIKEMTFFKGYTPEVLPSSAMSVTPRFDCLQFENEQEKEDLMKTVCEVVDQISHMNMKSEQYQQFHLKQLLNQLEHMFKTVNKIDSTENQYQVTKDLLTKFEDPSLSPIYWVSKWVDFSDKYGLAYQLSDSSTGAVFTDGTKLVLTRNKKNLQYIDENECECLYTVDVRPDYLKTKMTLLTYFEEYMDKNLLTAGESVQNEEREKMTRLPYLKCWFRTRTGIVLYLSNGTLQLNFSDDHTKVILCPIMKVFTYVDEKYNFKTCKFQNFGISGITSQLHEKLRNCEKTIELILKKRLFD